MKFKAIIQKCVSNNTLYKIVAKNRCLAFIQQACPTGLDKLFIKHKLLNNGTKIIISITKR